ncbi:MAG: OmpP1/FadL family transporter [Acidiferrobacteraceae bacterium]
MASMKRWAISAAVAAALAMPMTAFATTAGYFQLGYSSKNDGLAGAGVALPEDAMAQATNPAGISFVGSRFDIGAAGFWAFRGYSNTPGGPFPTPAPCALCGSNTNFFLIPHMALTYGLGGGSAIGLAMYGNGGMDTNYKIPPGPFDAGGLTSTSQTGVSFKQLFVQTSYAYKFARHDSVGLGLLYVRQYFSAYGLNMFGGSTTGAPFASYSSNPSALTNNGVDMATGFGLKLGTQVRLMRGLDFGLAYTPEIHMSRFVSYAGLFRDHGDFNIPQTWTAGLAFKPARGQTLAFDFQRIYYGGVPTIAATANCIGAGTCGSGNGGVNGLGSETGPGFGWKDITVYKLGYQLATSRQWTWRVGFAYNTEPVDPSQTLFNTLAPGVLQRDISVGFTNHLSHSQDLTVAAMWAMPKKVYSSANASGVTGFGAPTYIYLQEYQVEANWGIKF